MTTPTGKLAWGQAALYDAVDDRAVITAVTRRRLGLIWPVEVRAGAGLQIIITGGWLGVASCGDRSSAVVGSREDSVVMATPGPGTGDPRQDLVWCDTNPDEGTWELRVIPASQAANRPGLPLVEIAAPAGSNLASQMNLVPVDASLERRLMAFGRWAGAAGERGDTTWQGAAVGGEIDAPWCLNEPGQWYRVKATWNSVQWRSGSRSGRIGVGHRPTGQPASAAVLARSSAIIHPTNDPHAESVEWVFRHDKNAAAVSRVFSTRIWSVGAGTYALSGVLGQGDAVQITVEDIGS
jgi:hypothetical protein